MFSGLTSWRSEDDFVTSFLGGDTSFKTSGDQPFPSHLGAGLQPLSTAGANRGVERGGNPIFVGSPSYVDPFPFLGRQTEVEMKEDEEDFPIPSFQHQLSSAPFPKAQQQTGARYPTQTPAFSSRKRKTACVDEVAEVALPITLQDKAFLAKQAEMTKELMVLETQPPVEVRTRTPSERRHFSTSVRLLNGYKELEIEKVCVRLWYKLPSGQANAKQSILGGVKSVAVQNDGLACFRSLSMSEASTKHHENEFCLEFIPVTSSGKQLISYSVFSNGFYAYSHMKVLSRRKNVKLRAVSDAFGGVNGGQEMHVVGSPFVKGPFLSVIFRTPHGDVAATGIELYSDSVLFFVSPAYPDEDVISGMSAGMEIKADILVTNDGRNYSDAVPFTFLAEGSYRK